MNVKASETSPRFKMYVFFYFEEEWNWDHIINDCNFYTSRWKNSYFCQVVVNQLWNVDAETLKKNLQNFWDMPTQAPTNSKLPRRKTSAISVIVVVIVYA